ncbi:hypothetical protein LguiA_013045 [Lonicera macranthoides]
MGVFIRASNQGPPNIDEEIDVGGGPIAFAMDNANVRGSGAKSRSSKRSMTSLDALLETMSKTSCAKKAHFDSKATFVEEHTMAHCTTVLVTMSVFGEQYAHEAEKLISSKDWRTFFILSPPGRQLQWVNGFQ